MFTPLVLLTLTLAAFVTAKFGLNAPLWITDMAALFAIAAAVLVIYCALYRPAVRPVRSANKGTLVLDGSNILYWNADTPDLRSVASVVRILESQGYTPKLWFDANVGYLTEGRFMGATELAHRLKIDKEMISVVPKGSPADPFIIEDALQLGAPILSNDRFRDWYDDYPHLQKPGSIIQGKLQDRSLQMTPTRAQRPQASPPLMGEQRGRGTGRPSARQAPRRQEPRF